MSDLSWVVPASAVLVLVVSLAVLACGGAPIEEMGRHGGGYSASRPFDYAHVPAMYVGAATSPDFDRDPPPRRGRSQGRVGGREGAAMRAGEWTTAKKFQCRRCGRMVPAPAVQWFAYGTNPEVVVWDGHPAVASLVRVPLCEGCDARVAAVIEAWLDGPNGDDEEG